MNIHNKQKLLLEQAYKLVLEGPNVLVNRRTSAERANSYKAAIKKSILDYISNGSVGDLKLSKTPVTSLPDELTVVDGELKLDGSMIYKLPDSLKLITQHAFLNDTPLTQLPNDLVVEGGLNICDTNIDTLPSNLRVSEYLAASNTPLETIPPDLVVGGTLYLLDCPNLQSIPKSVKVGGKLYISNTHLNSKYSSEELKQQLPNIRGKIMYM